MLLLYIEVYNTELQWTALHVLERIQHMLLRKPEEFKNNIKYMNKKSKADLIPTCFLYYPFLYETCRNLKHFLACPFRRTVYFPLVKLSEWLKQWC